MLVQERFINKPIHTNIMATESKLAQARVKIIFPWQKGRSQRCDQ